MATMPFAHFNVFGYFRRLWAKFSSAFVQSTPAYVVEDEARREGVFNAGR